MASFYQPFLSNTSKNNQYPLTAVPWQPLVEMYRRTTTAKGRAQSGLFGIEGVRLIERAVRADADLVHILTTADFSQRSPRHLKLLDQIAREKIPLTHIPQETMTQLTQKRGLGDIVGIVQLPTKEAASILRSRPDAEPDSCLLLVAVDVVDPGNVGALVRTTHALGGTAVFAVGTSDPYHPKAIRTSMGSLFKMPILHYPTLAHLLPILAEAKIETVATVSTGGQLLPLAQLPSHRLAVLMGNEYWGLDKAVETAVQHKITIPMSSDIDSFSVNAAAAIVIYELQHKLSSSKSIQAHT